MQISLQLFHSQIVLGHIALLNIAAQHLIKNNDLKVVGGFYSANHDLSKNALTNTDKLISAKHRIKMLQLVTKNSPWLDVDRFVTNI